MRWVESGDVRLAVFEDGDPANPTMLLLHGYPDTHRVWDEVVERLRDRFHVVRYDVRGAGASTAPGDRRDYGFDRLMGDLSAVLDAVGKPKVHLAGHDMGAVQGWEAMSRPEVVDRVASYTSVGGPGLRLIWGDVPVQLIELTRDPFVTPALLASIRQWVPRLWHRRVAAGHYAQRSHPDLVAAMIAEFAAHVDGAAPTNELRRAQVGHKAFAGRLVVVTGAGSGIGLATARAFAAHGAEVVCADIDAGAAARAAEGIVTDLGGTASAAQVDVANGDQMEDFSRNIITEYGVPDIVVNNAGIAVAGPFLDHTVDDWRRTIDVNLWGVIHGCRLFGAAMVERGEGGHIVNVASLAAFAPSRLLPAYATSKAAVKMLGDCLRAELAGHGIGVSTICPGFVSTPIARNATYTSQDQREEAVRALERRGYPPERVAAHILRAVHRNQAVVPVNLEGKIGYALSRISPRAMRGLARLGLTARNHKFPSNDRAYGRR